MFKQHKTFDLTKEREPKTPDTFYKPKKCKYLKYILPPVLIAFFLFLILLNVDFDNEIYKISQPNVLLLVDEELSVDDQNFEMVTAKERNETIESEKEVIENSDEHELKVWSGQQNRNKRFEYRAVSNNSATKLAGAMKCESIKENCTLSCNDGSVSYVDESLGQLQEKCPNMDLALQMSKCEFYDGILKKTFFGGYFSLMYLAINECNLQTIQDAAFTHANVKNLETLILTNNQLLTLHPATLGGLLNIKYFEFKQLPLQKEFEGKDFFKSLATAVDLIMQPSINSTIIHDPLIWWQNSNLDSVLYLDLSNTNFQNILTVNSFIGFLNLEKLLLFNCNLHSFGLNTFDSVVNTLKYLDLRFNHLKTLEINFFYLMENRNIELNLELNEWFCQCDFELFYIFESYNDNMMDEIICHSPEGYYDLDLKQLSVICKASGPSVSTTKINSTPSTTTTSEITILTTLGLNSTDHTTFSTWETSPTTFTSVTSSIITTLKPSPTTSTPESSSIITPTTASQAPVDTTTTIQPIYTEKVTITCYKDMHKTDDFKTNILKQTISFSIYTISTTSIRIEIPLIAQSEVFTVLYFSNYSDYQSINGNTTSSKNAIAIKDPIIINNLNTSKDYLFCVIKDSSTAISPYDCQGHYLERMQQKAWLLEHDKAWFLTTCIILALIIFICSVFLVYCLLHHHPYWLIKCNKHILQVHNRPNEVLVVSRKSVKECLSSLNASPVSQRSSHYLKPLQPLRVTALSSAESSLYTSKLTVPLSKAPISPSTSSTQNSCCVKPDLNGTKLPPTACHVRKSKMDTSSITSEPIYQTIDHYEAVNF